MFALAFKLLVQGGSCQPFDRQAHGLNFYSEVLSMCMGLVKPEVQLQYFSVADLEARVNMRVRVGSMVAHGI